MQRNRALIFPHIETEWDIHDTAWFVHPRRVVLPAALIASKLKSHRLFSIEGLDLCLLPGAAFEQVADAVGQLRESTRQQLSVRHQP